MKHAKDIARSRRVPLLAAGLCVLLAACVALRGGAPSKAERGLRFNHALHVAQEIDCAACHGYEAGNPIKPDHQLCGVCHDIPEAQPSLAACGLCHDRPDYSVTPRVARIRAENIFDHGPHIAADVACASCHGDPDRAPLTKGWLKPMCMDCHGRVDPKMNDCSVCHRELRTDVVPTHRGAARLMHDSPALWTKLHGREAAVNPVYCAQCHDEEQSCAQCHRVTKPDSHTVTWTRRTHGLEASWNRNNCSVCHEEDSCLQCHMNTKPQSHRAGFGSPRDGHCVQCHFPVERNGCSVCHEAIEHRDAKPSPHLFGIYPPDCARCHPGGVPTQAPHPLNSTAQCIFCHR